MFRKSSFGARATAESRGTVSRVDDDHRSPLVVTVDEEGLYGFRIVVDIAGSAAATPPSPGDAPELVGLRRFAPPVVELTAIERGDGNLADHLIFRWKVADDNLEPRPIALFYSSRPTGPWSAIATNLEDTGEYAWRVERSRAGPILSCASKPATPPATWPPSKRASPIDFAPLGSRDGHLAFGRTGRADGRRFAMRRIDNAEVAACHARHWCSECGRDWQLDAAIAPPQV